MGRNQVENIDGTVLGGVTAGAYRRAPWHGHGIIVDATGAPLGEKRHIEDNPRTVDEIIDLGSLNWEPRQLHISDLDTSIMSSTSLLVRDGWPTAERAYELGVHSENYGVIPNRTCVEFVAEILRHRSDATLRSVTTLHGGRIAFAVVEFSDEIMATRRNGTTLDKHTPFMGVYWSHDGRFPLGVRFMRHEWVCENTFTPWKAAGGLTVRHTRHAVDHAAVALDAIRGMVNTMTEFDRHVEELLRVEMTRDRFVELLRHSSLLGERPEPKVSITTSGVSTKDNAGKLWDRRFDEIVAEWDDYTDHSTAFDFVMGVQGYEQHRQTVRGSNRDAKTIVRLLRNDWPMTDAAVKLVTA